MVCQAFVQGTRNIDPSPLHIPKSKKTQAAPPQKSKLGTLVQKSICLLASYASCAYRLQYDHYMTVWSLLFKHQLSTCDLQLPKARNADRSILSQVIGWVQTAPNNPQVATLRYQIPAQLSLRVAECFVNFPRMSLGQNVLSTLSNVPIF